MLDGKLKTALQALEKEMIIDALKIKMWNRSKAAIELGISRASLIMKIKQYEIKGNIWQR